ncbi:hypothetical protein GCM10023346_22160 [Arthrobacter gyeryongensis]|uniref:Uncharacterized protein n=1 Tax=Arthrobacter gyeryongensis TaxID=1650592 RepID=A0ABP9SEN7_9MICC
MPSESEILELRVHGVLNSPPYEMLCVEPDEVVPARSGGIKLADDRAGFYRAKTRPRNAPTTLEAYSWGKLDRFGLPGFLGKAGRTFYNLGWFLIAPFGFANVAYWSRVVKANDRREDGVDPGTGASLVRLFGLLLTLLLAAAIATAVMDLVAVQCFRIQDTTQQMCNNLPHWFDGLRALTRGQRLAAVSPFPILAVVLLAVVGWLGDVRFRTRINGERRVSVPPAGGSQLVDSVVLAAPHLWIRRANSPTGVLHIAATVQFTAFLLAADASSRSTGDNATAASTVFAVSCALLSVTAVAVLIWAKSIRAPRRDTSPRMRFAVVTFLLSAFVYAGAITVAVRTPAANETAPFTAAQLAPTVLVALLTILAVSGCFMRLNQRSAVIWGLALLLVGVAGLMVTATMWDSAPAPVLAGFELCDAAVVLVAGTLLAQGRRATERPFGRKAEAWHGMTPAVTMFVSILFQAFYASAIVVGTGNWLRGGSLLWTQDTGEPLFRDVTAQGTVDISVPFIYRAFGGAVLAVLAAEALLIVALLPKLRGSVNIGNPPVDQAEEHFVADIMAVRRRSALLQRGEPLLGVASAATAFGVAASLALTILHGNGDGHQWLQSRWGWHFVSVAGAWVTTSALAAGGLVIVGIAVSSAARGTNRPIGLLWDLVAWLPRAAHPFGPACYFERAVPELAGRMIQWLTDESDKDDPAEPKPALPDRRVLLATHSLGAVLGIAALYHLAAIGRNDLLPNIRLLTFGVQLRPYFGRFFPELCGPNVLGTHGLRHPRTFATDPWWDRDLPRPPRPGQAAQPAVRPRVHLRLDDLLDNRGGNATAWQNIWRRTDPLGFPVSSYPGQNALDLPALEIEPDSYQAVVAEHGNYFRTTMYTQARERLLENWENVVAADHGRPAARIITAFLALLPRQGSLRKFPAVRS